MTLKDVNLSEVTALTKAAGPRQAQLPPAHCPWVLVPGPKMGLPLGLHRTLTPTSVSQLREKAGRGHHLTGGDTRSLSASPRKGVSDNRSRPQGLGSSSSALSLPSAVGETVETGQKRGEGRLGEGQPSTRGATCSRQGSGPQRATWAQRPSSEPVNYMGIILGPTYHAPA